MELLSDADLKYYAKKLNIPLHAVLQKDLFSKFQIKKGAYIINLQNSTVGNGTHWTSLVITDTHAVYYDSFGLSIPTPILKFIIKSKAKLKIIYSTDQLQVMDSIFCGWFALYFIYFMTRLHPRCKDAKYLLNKHNAIYSVENKYLNDSILQKLIKKTFSNKLK